MKLTIEILTAAVERDAAIVRVQRLQPVGWLGEKIFPSPNLGEHNNDPARL